VKAAEPLQGCGMLPEFQILIINAVCLGVAYLGILPGLARQSLTALALTDAAVTVVALVTAGMLFWGSGQGFTLLVFEVNWLVFALVTFAAMEGPLFVWFARKHGIDRRK